MSIMSGSVIPATVLPRQAVLGGAAIRVFNAEGIPRPVVSGPATPVVVLTDADIEDNGGPFRVAGGAALPMVNVVDRPIRGGYALCVYPVDADENYDPAF